MTTMTHDTTRTAGLGFAMVSAASFGLSGSLARGLMDAGWSAAAAVSAGSSVGPGLLFARLPLPFDAAL